MRLGTEYPYDFRRLNCGYYLWDWLSGPEQTQVELLYLTPREALEKILEHHPPKTIRRLRTDLALLEDYLVDLPHSTQDLAGEALTRHEALLELDDLVLRLLVINAAEPNATPLGYDVLQEMRSSTLEARGGKQAAKQLVALQEEAWEEELPSWESAPQGPAVLVGHFSRTDTNESGIMIHWEAGLHDQQATSSSGHSLKEVEFLSGTIQQSEESTKGDLTLFSIGTQRAFTPIRHSASNGASLGYSGLPNTLGLEGLYASAWSGITFKQGGNWFGARLTLSGSDLQAKAEISATPGLTFRRDWGRLKSAANLDFNLSDGPGWFLEQSYLFTEALDFNLGWLESPHRERQLSLTLEYRF